MGRYLLNRTRVCASLTESSKNVWRSECITQSVASCKCSLLLILSQFLVKMIKRNDEIWSRDSRLTGTQSRFNNDLILTDEISQARQVELKYDRLYSFQWYLDAGISNTNKAGPLPQA